MLHRLSGQLLASLKSAVIAGSAMVLMAATTPASAESLLDIPPVPESGPDQSWAAIAEMVMVYYDVPNTGPGDMQCSIAYYLTGTPNCYKAQDESEFTAVSRAIKGYPQFAHESFGELPIAMRWEEAKTIPPAEIIQEIRFERPILVQIEPARNEGEAKAQKRAVLIVGFDGTADNLQLIINDPKVYPGTQNPYLEFGGHVRDNSGQYQIGYADFQSFLKWSATLYKIKPD
ncbi:hypothetical protein [Dongia sp.]|uniref:hypothetical protein n=1 Tax=Dongia sp. TaxID=1977262 RepID=UPI0035B343BE